MLSNLETRDRKLIQIMLVGQPELENLLNMSQLRQLRQRIPGVCRIPMLSREDVDQYILYRLKVASQDNGGPVFTEDALEEIYHYSAGTPRLINILCDRVLLLGYVANTTTISGRIVREGIRDLENREGPVSDRRIKPM
jgi:general secretion pathway protein A